MVLIQSGCPIAFYSHSLPKTKVPKSAYEIELFAAVMAVQKWKHYLVHLPFTLKTDQFSLKYLWEQKEVPSQYAKWLVKLMGFQFTIEYREGKSNKVADALSRMPQEDSITINDISAITITDFDTIHSEVDHNTFLQDIFIKLTSNPTAVSHYPLQQGQLFYKDRLVIPKSSSVVPTLLSEFHNGAIGGRRVS